MTFEAPKRRNRGFRSEAAPLLPERSGWRMTSPANRDFASAKGLMHRDGQATEFAMPATHTKDFHRPQGTGTASLVARAVTTERGRRFNPSPRTADLRPSDFTTNPSANTQKENR